MGDDGQQKREVDPPPDRGEDIVFPESYRKLLRALFAPCNRRRR